MHCREEKEYHFQPRQSESKDSQRGSEHLACLGRGVGLRWTGNMGADAAGDGAAWGGSQVTEHYAEPVILPLRPASFSAKTNMVEDGHTQNTHCSLFFKKENRKGECNYYHANVSHSDLCLCINHLQLLIALYWEQLLEKCLTSQSWVLARRAGRPACLCGALLTVQDPPSSSDHMPGPSPLLILMCFHFPFCFSSSL